ncbi:hypothetical protein [Actinacidiphila reveromycinica]|uniref:hypothetical protein n=1 Tax=Actinacidiphila reveromycinica TaxID=659352 RepID=UPI001921ACD4|nr:hypothetical protein [Streptomyces sp. SN-593]
MTITPDDLAARFAPPPTNGPLYSRLLTFTDGAYALAERALDVLPRGHHLDEAVRALEAAAHWVCAGLAAIEADTATEQHADQVPYVVLAAPTDAPSTSDLGEFALNVSLWRTCIRGSTAHPLARLVALTLSEVCDDHGYIADSDQPTLDDLCLGTGLPSADVLRAVEDLATAGWIGRHNDGAGTRYQLRLPASQNGHQ